MTKIVDNPENYFKSLIPPRDDLMIKLEVEAEKESIPIVGPVLGELLHVLVAATKARKILELGTATGYSAIYLARACEAVKGLVITIENNRNMADRAEQNFQQAGVSDRIDMRVGDAVSLVSQLQGNFDFIFLDIEKQEYVKLLGDCHRLLSPGGLLVADNVGFKDADDFNRAIAEHSEWRSISLFSFLPLHSPENDALCVALRC